MSSLVTLPEKEIKSITSNFSTDTNLTYSPRTLRTVDDCVEQIVKAEEVSLIAQSVIRDRMQGDGFLKAKKIICPDDWNKSSLSHANSKKWKSFLGTLDKSGKLKFNCIDKKGGQAMNVGYLLEFAGYKEDGGVIESPSHFREAKKLAPTETQLNKQGKEIEVKTTELIDETYTQAVEANGGEVPKTAREVVEVVQASKNKVSSEELFMEEYPQYQDIESSHNAFKRDDFISKKLPKPNKDEWKHFYRLVAKTIHPDKGGDETDMAILTGLKEVYEYLHKQDANQVRVDEKVQAYAEWCEDKGCEPHDWIEV